MTGRTLRLELDVIPGDLRPGNLVDFAGRAVCAFTTTTLFRPGEWGRMAEPGLLKSAETSRDGRRWRLEPNAHNHWSSGRPMTAKHIAQSLTTSATCSGTPLAAQFAALLANARVEDDQITLDLKRPFACLPALLSAEAFSPAAAEPEQAGEGGGPFSYAGAFDERSFGLRRNALGSRIWPEGPDTIIFVVTDNPAQGVRLFERGLIDVTCNPNLPAVALGRYRDSQVLRHRDLLLAGVLLFAKRSLTTADARGFRRNISAAISRDRIARASHGSLAPLNCLMGLWDHQDITADDISSVASAAIGEPLTLAYADFEPNGSVVEQIAEDIEQKMDVRVSLRPMNYRDYLTCMASPDVDLIYSLIQPSYNDPSSLLSMLLSSQRFNPARGDFSEAVQRAEATFLADQRLVACRSASRILAEEVPLVPVVRAVSKCLASSSANDLVLGPDGLFRPPLAAVAGGAP